MVILGSVFFVFVPLVLLLAITHVGRHPRGAAGEPGPRPAAPEGAGRRSAATPMQPAPAYALAVYLFAPVAVVVPLTIATAVGATTIVGERERGTGEFLAHSPAALEEIYLGKLIASLLPGYLTTVVGFGLYSLIVNLVVGPKVGGWFFPTQAWWVLMIWVVPPFLALTLAIVVRFSARVKSSAAAQQVAGLVSLPMIIIAYSQSTGALFGATNTGYVIGAARVDRRRSSASCARHALDDPCSPPRRRRRSLSPRRPLPRLSEPARITGHGCPAFRARTVGRGFRRATVRLSPRRRARWSDGR